MSKRYDYQIYKEISKLDFRDYQDKVAIAANKSGILKFAVFRGYAYWLREMHDIVKIEFSRNKKLSNEELSLFKSTLDKTFGFGEDSMFVIYSEVDR